MKSMPEECDDILNTYVSAPPPREGKIVVEEPIHTCNNSEACDKHKAVKWLADLRSSFNGDIPDSEVLALYETMLMELRYLKIMGDSATFYQNALCALVERAGGSVYVTPGEIARAQQNGVLSPEVDAEGNTLFKFNTMEKEIANAQARRDRLQAMEDAEVKRNRWPS